ncbi:MAG: DUF1028 domain-containing protein [Limnohabitans sp.]|jgi:uncharacterized Ntn-hydrolase superfamily protein|nr:DUF1028 domain-containing protein [bacterium]MCX7265773.1 DUF1028 domain-containing protein [Burkholderiales bacterium]
MTWSILARTPDGQFGVAIASRFFAVGALCVHTQRGVGALSTQALMNPLFGPLGLQLMQSGLSAAQVMHELLLTDEGRAQRQVHLLPAQGLPVAHTGTACIDWCGHMAGDDFSIAGNMLAGPQVLEETARAFQAAAGAPLAERLLQALQAGEDAGGDKRGKQSAALKIQADEDYLQLDLRVDDHAEPVLELKRLLEKSLERFQPFLTCLPGRHNPVGLTDRSLIEAQIERFHQARLKP